MTENTQNRMFQAFLKKELPELDNETRQEELLKMAFANPDFQQFGKKLSADVLYSLTEMLQDQSLKEKQIYKDEGISGLVIRELIFSMDRVGMNSEDSLQLLYATQFIKEYVPKDVYKQVVNTILLRLKK